MNIKKDMLAPTNSFGDSTAIFCTVKLFQNVFKGSMPIKMYYSVAARSDQTDVCRSSIELSKLFPYFNYGNQLYLK